MDLALFKRVLWRFRAVVAVGFVLAVLLAILTVSRIDLAHGGLAPKTPPIYAASAGLLITQPGFPWGSAVQDYTPSSDGQAPAPAGDLGRLSALTNLYVQLANSDVIRLAVIRRAPKGATITAVQNYSYSPSFYSTALPILTISGTGTSRRQAIATTQLGVNILVGYLKRQQDAAGIEQNRRVLVQELQRPRKTVVVNATKKTLAIVVFLTIMLAVTGLAFVLENLLPHPKAAVAKPEATPQLDTARRSA
jgi:hypothetical protein